MPSFSFATFLIVCPTSFFLGIIFSLFPYDYPLLWASGPTPDSHYAILESHLRLLHASPNIIVRILHIMISLGLLGLVVKLYKPSESNMLFDGGSLVLYMCGIIVYIANIVKGLRIVTEASYGTGMENLSQDQLDEVNMGAYDQETGQSVLGREDNLKVLAASNTILALVLLGVLVLQAGQWYAERAEQRETRKLRETEGRDRDRDGNGEKDKDKDKKTGGSSIAVGRKNSGKESKKVK